MANQKITTEGNALDRLAELVAVLRGENGCPWDRKQTPRTMASKLLEETYELVDAVSSGSAEDVCEELGDVLFHIFFIARQFQEEGRFDMADVADGIVRKMIRRHPHVFKDHTADSPEAVKQKWHEIKQVERAGQRGGSVLDSIPKILPALMRAYRVSERAARSGFDWNAIGGVMEKVEEEWEELREAFRTHVETGGDKQAVRLEFGDLLFTLVNVARFLGIQPEEALGEAIDKFDRRFRHMEAALDQGHRRLTELHSTEKDAMWAAAKQATTAG